MEVASKMIRAYCKWCCNDNEAEVLNCGAVTCPLWRYRMTHEVPNEACERLPRSKAIHARCLQCIGSNIEVANCDFTDCPLYCRRKGYLEDENGNKITRQLSEEQKAASAERMRKIHEQQKP